jgi:hypothetical protein
MEIKPVYICNLLHKNSEYYPTSNGVFIEKDLYIYFCRMGGLSPTFFCKVPNLTWQANDFGVYYKDTSANRIIHVSKANGAPCAIAQTTEFFWQRHNKGGVFVYNEKINKLTHHGQSEQIDQPKLHKNFFQKLFQPSCPKNVMFEDGAIVASFDKRLFYPFEAGFFFREDSNIYYRNVKTNSNLLITTEPPKFGGGSWNAYSGEVYKNIENTIYFCSSHLIMSEEICKTDFVNYKGAKGGVIVNKNFEELWYYPKPERLKGIYSI